MKPNLISPKAEFCSLHKSEAERHMEMVYTPQFRRAAEVALLEYCVQLNCDDPRAALKIRGAKAVLDILLNLGNVDSSPVRADEDDKLTPV